MKCAIVYVLDETYIKYLKHSLYSLLFNNSKHNFDIIFFYDTEATLIKIKNIIKQYKNNFLYKPVPISSYTKTLNNYNPYYRLEIFTLEEYDKILYLDCDTIICKDISEIFYNNIDFGAVKYLYNTEYFYKIFNLKNFFNAGVLLIGKKYLNQDTYINLLNKLHFERKKYNQLRGNEPFFNSEFNTLYTPLPYIYNATPYTTNYDNLKNASIVHLQGFLKYFYDLKSLSKFKKSYEFNEFKNCLETETSFNLIARVFLKIKKYII